MAAAFRQGASNGASASNTTITQLMGSAVLAGSRLLAYVVWGATSGIVLSVSDTINGTTGWIRVDYSNASEATGPTQGEFWTNPNSAAGAAPTITATFNVTQAFRALSVHEVTGTDTSEGGRAVASARSQSSVADFTTANITPLCDGCYIAGGCSNDIDATVPTADAPYTLRQTTANQVTATEDQVQTTAAAVGAGFTFSVAKSGVVNVVAFIPAGARAAVSGIDYTAFPKDIIAERAQGLL